MTEKRRGWGGVFGKCAIICADLGVWGAGGTHLEIRGVGVSLGRLARNGCRVWGIITLMHHNSVVQTTGDRDDYKPRRDAQSKVRSKLC